MFEYNNEIPQVSKAILRKRRWYVSHTLNIKYTILSLQVYNN